jgi:hypothetical protein
MTQPLQLLIRCSHFPVHETFLIAPGVKQRLMLSIAIL